MNAELPLEVLGLMAPLLCWVEGSEGHGLPRGWSPQAQPVKDRQLGWLSNQLPTYSQDGLDEIIRLAHAQRHGKAMDGLYFPPLNPAAASGEADESLRGERLSVAFKRLCERHCPAPPRRESLEPPRSYRLMDAFQRLCERYFHWTGNELTIRGNRLEELHELALCFPVRHLIRHSHARATEAGFLSRQRALSLPEQLGRLQVSSMGLRAVVEQGLTEGHLHLGGVMSAEETWADYLLRTVPPAFLNGMQPDEGRLLILSRAALRLLALGLFQYSLGPSLPAPPFALLPLLDAVYYSRSRLQERVCRNQLSLKLRGIVGERLALPMSQSPRNLDWMLRMIDETAYRLWLGRKPVERHQRQSSGFRSRIRDLERLHFEIQRTLISLEYRVTKGRLPPEDVNSKLYVYLHELYYRYLICSTHHWHLATQSGRTTGLREFQRFYDSKHRGPLASGSPGEDVRLIVERLEGNQMTEGRLSPPSRAAMLVPWILGFAEQAEKGQLEKFGFTIHFIKECHALDKTTASRQGYPALRFGRIRERTRIKAHQLIRLLSNPHPVVPFIVGIDAASLELTTPPEVFAPAFRFLREYPIDLRNRSLAWELGSRFNDVAALVDHRRLGMTYHVGEDFRHLLSGLRAIHEVIEFLDPRPGDRLGHAIALALDPEVWLAHLGYQAVLPKQEWLDTLVWFRHFLGTAFERIGEFSVEDEIQRLSQEIYGSGQSAWSPLALYEAWLTRQLEPGSVDFIGLRDGECNLISDLREGLQNWRWNQIQSKVLGEVKRRVSSKEAFKLLALYWYSSKIRQRGDRIINVDMLNSKRHWLKTCREAQRRMWSLLKEKEVVVEVNPTSNRVIGPMPRLSDHHIFQMTLDKNFHYASDFPVTVNTDDPGVFNTSLPHEYYLIGEVLLRQGVPEPKVARWLELLRRNGRDFSFLRTLPKNDSRHLKSLVRSLRKVNPAIRRRLERTARAWPGPARHR